MISLEHAKRTDRLLRATTGLTVAEFEALAGRLEAVWAAQAPVRRSAASSGDASPAAGARARWPPSSKSSSSSSFTTKPTQHRT